MDLDGGKKCFLFVFLKPKALTQLFWTNQFSASGGELEWWGWQDSFGKVELVPSNLRKQILNIFEKCAGLLVRKFGLCLYSPTAWEQSLFPAVEEKRGWGVGGGLLRTPTFQALTLLELADSSVLSTSIRIQLTFTEHCYELETLMCY